MSEEKPMTVGDVKEFFKNIPEEFNSYQVIYRLPGDMGDLFHRHKISYKEADVRWIGEKGIYIEIA